MDTMFLIGVALNIAMAFWIRKEVNEDTLRLPSNLQNLNWKRWLYPKFLWDEGEPLRFLAITTYIKIAIIISMVMFCIAMFGGAIAAKWILYTGTFQFGEINFLGRLFAVYFFGFLPIIIIYVLQYLLLKLSKFQKIYLHVIFFLTYIVSILFWKSVLQ